MPLSSPTPAAGVTSPSTHKRQRTRGSDSGAGAPPIFTPRSCWAGRSGTSAHARSRGGPLGLHCAGAVVFPTWVDRLVPGSLSLAGVPTDLGSWTLWRSPAPPFAHTPPQALARLFPSDSASDPASSFYTPTVISRSVRFPTFLLVESFQTFGLLPIQLLQKFYLICSFNLYLF